MIYIVSLGYDYEGENIQKVFSSFTSAENYVIEFIDKEGKASAFHGPWLRKRQNLWESYGTYMIIHESEVED